MSSGLDVRPQVEVFVLHADRHVAGEGALLLRRRRRGGGREVAAAAAVVAVPASYNLRRLICKLAN